MTGRRADEPIEPGMRSRRDDPIEPGVRPRRDDAIEPGVKRLGDALDGVVRSLRPLVPERAPGRADGRGGVAAASLGGLFRGWDEAVGEPVATHVRPVVLDGGRLVVEVAEPAWATQLQFLEQDLLTRVRPLVAPAPVTALEVRVRGVRKGRGNRKT